jgi:UDP-glucose 4-epimerase
MAETGARKRIVVTGIAGQLGRLLAKRLHRSGAWDIVGIDRRPFEDKPADLVHHRVDIRSKRTRDVFRSQPIAALVHLGLMHDPRQPPRVLHEWNVEATQSLLEYCHLYRVPKVVVLTSATVYGARPENPQFLTEDAPLLAGRDDPTSLTLVEADMLASSFFWKYRDCETVILRPVHILGRNSNAPSSLLRMQRVPFLIGFDPMMQVIHEEDVVDAVVLALGDGVRGIYNVVGQGEGPLSVLVRESGKPTLPLPHLLAPAIAKLAWGLGLSPFAGTEFAHLQYVCMVDGSRARRELGFKATRSIKEAVRAAVDPL